MGARDRFPRMVCDCQKCRIPCRVAPGFLGVGDIDRIQKALKIEAKDFHDWAADHFAASDGAKVWSKGRVFTVPTIIPQQRETVGECVFHSAEGLCTIHENSPIGCSHFSVCENPPEREILVREALLEIADEWRKVEQRAHSNYVALWRYLSTLGRIPIPTLKRLERFNFELEKIRKGAAAK